MIPFAETVITSNNLGGLGPNLSDPPFIEITNLPGLIPEDVSVRIFNTSEYIPSLNPGGGVEFNGLSAGLGNINVLSDSEVDLTFSFFQNDEPYVMPMLFVKWFDFDNHATGNRIETVRPIVCVFYLSHHLVES